MQETNKNVLLGSHISMCAPDYFLGTVKEALSYGENTFMFYTGAPQNSIRVPLEKCKIIEGQKLLKENNIDIDKIVVHAPYIINLGNSIDENKFELAKKVLKTELNRTYAFGCKLLVLHPGLHIGQGEEVGLKQIIKGLNEVLKEDTTDVTICLETMAGKGSELGKTFDEIAYIINNSQFKNRLGVCLDTCHINDAGYNVENIDEVLDLFDKKIGLNRLKVIHLNDSKNIKGSHKDRHENIGKGTIGLNTLKKYVFNEKLIDVPKILETPYINGLPPYKDEIKLLKE
ncbi:MAG: deoxyribonuclease IV [Mollicutes bacterium]|nr:deoxyribonuclease IV [Mollicutes bacterium]MDD7263867.1 deoxyribonuclease IV [bacterium]MDY4979748.1 deoxyribonuclease IV [Candidatus Onthovivens sp.]